MSGSHALLGDVVPLFHGGDCVLRVSDHMNWFELWQVLLMSLRNFQMWVQGTNCV